MDAMKVRPACAYPTQIVRRKYTAFLPTISATELVGKSSMSSPAQASRPPNHRTAVPHTAQYHNTTPPQYHNTTIPQVPQYHSAFEPQHPRPQAPQIGLKPDSRHCRNAVLYIDTLTPCFNLAHDELQLNRPCASPITATIVPFEPG